VHQVEVRDGVEGEPAVQVVQWPVQQRTEAGGSGIGDQELDVKVFGRGQEGRGPSRIAEVDGHGPGSAGHGHGAGGLLPSHPGTCEGLLGALGAAGHLGEILQVSDTWIAAPLRDVLTEGRDVGVLAADEPADAANAILGGLLLAVLGRAMAGADPTERLIRCSVASWPADLRAPRRLPFPGVQAVGRLSCRLLRRYWAGEQSESEQG
jgi:hypothetical protein